MYCILCIGSSKATAHMKPQLQDINNWVVPYVTDKWEKVFVQLLGDKYHHVMATLRKDHQGNNEAGCIAMFEEWFQLCPNPTWNHLITALRSDSVRKINLAERLHQRIGMSICVHVIMHRTITMHMYVYVCMYVYIQYMHVT